MTDTPRPAPAAPLLFLHGFPLDAAMWRHARARFGDERTVLAPNASDLMPAPPAPATMDAMADGALVYLNQHGPAGAAVLVGHSMGGYVALAFARRHPERVAGLVLVDSRATADTDAARADRNAMTAAIREAGPAAGTRSLVERLLGFGAPEGVLRQVFDTAAAGDPETLVRCLEAMRDRRDATDVLADLRAPALVVWGADEALMPREAAEAAVARLSHGRLAVIERAGHVPPLENPDDFHAALSAFLRQHRL